MKKSEATSIFLVGMMASGKSTVGRELAFRLGWPFYDVDAVIEKETGCSVREIFKTKGEGEFRRIETETMARLTSQQGIIVAMGGGAPMFEINRKLLKRGIVVQLTVSVSDVLERTRFDKTRPLLEAEDVVGRIRTLLLERTPFYDAVSDVRMQTTRTNPADIVDRLLEEKSIQETIKNAEAKKGKESD